MNRHAIRAAQPQISFVATTWEDGMVDLSGSDRAVLANVTLEGEGIGNGVRETIEREAMRILKAHGPRAFENTKEAAALHEAGHVVMYVLLGYRVRRARIAQRPGGWLGMTETYERWNVYSPSDPPTKTLNLIRALYAGVAAERLFDPDHRKGSSLDEIIVSQLIGAMVAERLDVPAEAYWQTEVHEFVCRSLIRHQIAVKEAAKHLIRREKLRGTALEQIRIDVQATMVPVQGIPR